MNWVCFKRLIMMMGLFLFSSNTLAIQGIITQITDSVNMIQKNNMNFYVFEKQYTPGLTPPGVVFDYSPTSTEENPLFGIPPIIFLSVRKDGSGTDCLMSPVITWKTTTSAGVVLTIITGAPLAVSEADNTYYVTLLATGT